MLRETTSPHMPRVFLAPWTTIPGGTNGADGGGRFAWCGMVAGGALSFLQRIPAGALVVHLCDAVLASCCGAKIIGCEGAEFAPIARIGL